MHFQGTVWGQAFQVKEKEAFSYLDNRECKLGGYLTTISTFYPRQDDDKTSVVKPFPVILYLATSSNQYWLGDSPLPEIANQIVNSSGNSGHNVEYLLKLAEFIRENIPEAIDDHLFTLENLVRSIIEREKLSLDELMGGKTVKNKLKEGGAVDESDDDGNVGNVDDGNGEMIGENAGNGNERTESYHFTSNLPKKNLRCVNIC